MISTRNYVSKYLSKSTKLFSFDLVIVFLQWSKALMTPDVDDDGDAHDDDDDSDEVG